MANNQATKAKYGAGAACGDRRAMRHVPRLLVAGGDVGVILAGSFLAFIVRFGDHIPASGREAFWGLSVLLGIGTLLVLAGLGLYERRLNGFLPILWGLVTGVILLSLATAAASYWFREFAFPRSVILIGGGFQLVLLMGWRRLIWWADYRLHGQRKLLVLGDRDDVLSLFGKLLEVPGRAFRVLDVLPPERADEFVARLSEADAMVVMPSIPPSMRRQVVAACLDKGQDVYLVPSGYEVMVNSARVSRVDDLLVLQLEGFQLSWAQAVGKRTVDVLVALVALVVTAPVMAVLMVLIPASSPGSPFYVQRRVGQHGRVFRLYKLRSMVADAERRTGPVLATTNDPRITRMGRFLRGTRLDELPQFLNVLRGDMSIVGPRPERPKFVAELKAKNPSYHYRHLVKPGLTGLAQAYGRYDTSPEDKLRFDLYYIRNYSLLLDVQIILQTIPVVLTPSAARGRNTQLDDNAIALLSNVEYRQKVAGKRAL